MKGLLLTAAFGVLAMCDAAAPCRCAERTLGEYFGDADEVAVGGLVDTTSVEIGGVRLLEMQVRLDAPPHRTFRPDPPAAGSVVRYRTPTESAGCGVEARVGATYVFFATRSSEAEPAMVDTCSGTRIFLAGGETPPGEFTDVPARFVAGQLNALAAMDVLSEIVENAPDDSDPQNETLIGLLDVAGFSHAGFARVHERPDAASPLLVATGSYDGLETREVGYEEPGAVVYARSGRWYRLRLTDGRFGWLHPDFAGTYLPYPDVAVNRLNYLTDFHGFVWPNPGAGIPTRFSSGPEADPEIPAEVHEVTMIGGSPWLRVTILRASPCEGGDGEAAASGWIPAFGVTGEPSAWFYSRGC